MIKNGLTLYTKATNTLILYNHINRSKIQKLMLPLIKIQNFINKNLHLIFNNKHDDQNTCIWLYLAPGKIYNSNKT